MFEEFIQLKLAEAAIAWGKQANELAETQYLQAARDWAQNKIRGAINPAPIVPRVAVFDVTADGRIVGRLTDAAVSSVTPESFLPTYGTDVNAIGGPIGGLIPGYVDRFYAASDANPQAGDIHRAGGDVFVYQRPTPFGGFWKKA